MNYDPAIAQGLAQASADAYTLAGLARPGQPLQRIIEVRETDTHVIVRASETVIVVAFRGTADLRNWLTDLDARKELVCDHCGAAVHAGFLNAWLSVKADLQDALQNHRGKQIYLTGHSLGGALAMLAAMDLHDACDVAGVYTFGQPRVGNPMWSACYDDSLRARTFRIVHADDIVPRVPWLLRSYLHAGTEVFYPVAGPCQPMIDAGFWQKLPWDARNVARALCYGNLGLLAEHHVNNYVKLFGGSAAIPSAQRPSSDSDSEHRPLSISSP